jgi:mannose-6-phosphate isomerase-like protein (cupin superfamily)
MSAPVERIEKPWGYELIWARTDRYAGKIIHINRGESLSYQFHRVKDETIHLLRGLLDLEVGTAEGDRRTVRMRPDESYRIPPGLRHRMTAVEECDILEASTPELDDIVRLEDRYGRAPVRTRV